LRQRTECLVSLEVGGGEVSPLFFCSNPGGHSWKSNQSAHTLIIGVCVVVRFVVTRHLLGALRLNNAVNRATVDTTDLAIGPTHLFDVVQALFFSLELLVNIYELHLILAQLQRLRCVPRAAPARTGGNSPPMAKMTDYGQTGSNHSNDSIHLERQIPNPQSNPH
jgi:hypothetical protein